MEPIATRERGMTLVEILVVCFIAAGLTLAVIVAFRHPIFQRHAALSTLQSALDRARGLAQTSGNGATIVKFIAADAGMGNLGYVIVVCAGRPITGKTFGPCSPGDLQQGDIAITNPTIATNDWAIYVDSRGSIAAGPWSSSYANTIAGTPAAITSEPACATGTSVSVQFTGGESSSTHTVDCDTGVYQ